MKKLLPLITLLLLTSCSNSINNQQELSSVSKGYKAEQEGKYDEAVYWYRKAIDSDNSAAGLNNLGTMYLYGHGVDKDENKALYLMQQSALRGNSHAMKNLGNIYLGNTKGVSIQKNCNIAMPYLFEAARKGSKEAQNTLLSEFGITADSYRGNSRDAYALALLTGQNPGYMLKKADELQDQFLINAIAQCNRVNLDFSNY